jgi:hypothetical protein
MRILLLTFIAISASADRAAFEADYATRIQPLLQDLCYECHADDKAKGDVRLDGHVNLDALIADVRLTDRMTDALAFGEMPPKKADPLSDAERQDLLAWLRSSQSFIRTDLAKPGYVPPRRLNRQEYNNTVRDLLGVDLAPATHFPADDTGYGFDTIASVLKVSPLLAERYLGAASDLVSQVVFEQPRPSQNAIYIAPATMRPSRDAGGGPVGDGYVISSNGSLGATESFAVGGEYLVRVTASPDLGGEEPPHMVVSVAKRVVGEWFVPEHNTYEAKVLIRSGLQDIRVRFTNDFYEKNVADRNLTVERIDIIGPLTVIREEPPTAHTRIFSCEPRYEEAELQCARTILAEFAGKAFRRPLEVAEIAKLVALFEKARAGGESFEGAVSVCLQAILVSPHFLFRIENAGTLSDHQLATRLSYFLWSSMPDGELRRLADSGLLGNPQVRSTQIQRMLADPRALALAENFGGQWLELRKLAELQPEEEDFDETLRESMRKETELFMGHLIREDRSILEFLDADYTFLNDRLAAHYGIKGVLGPGFRPVSLRSSQRRGVLTHASLLSISSHPARTSPVLRGKFIMEQIIGMPTPPPPADATPLDENKVTEPGASLREIFEAHRDSATCSSCHSRLDPLGFAFEHFDEVGRWRDTLGDKPVNATGKLPNGQPIADHRDLIASLRSSQDRFARTFIEKMMIYALGRGLTQEDNPSIHGIYTQVAAKGFRFSSVVQGIVESVPFREQAERQ